MNSTNTSYFYQRSCAVALAAAVLLLSLAAMPVRVFAAPEDGGENLLLGLPYTASTPATLLTQIPAPSLPTACTPTSFWPSLNGRAGTV